MGKRNEKQREKHKAYMKEYRKAHREELKKYSEAHREEKKAYMKKYCEAHKEKLKEYRLKNKDKINQYHREYNARKKQEKLLQQQQEEQLPNIQDVEVILEEPIIQAQPVQEQPIQQKIDFDKPQVFLENVEWLDILEEIRKEKSNLYSLIQYELDIHYTISNKNIKFVVEDSINSYWHANAMSNYYLLKDNIQFIKDIVKKKTGEDFEITVEYDNIQKNKQLESITRENFNNIRNIIIENLDNIIAPVENLKADYDNLKVEKENLKADYDNLKVEKQTENDNHLKKEKVLINQIGELQFKNKKLQERVEKISEAQSSNDNGIRPIKSEYGGLLFRSKSEKRIAIYLDEIGAQWSYEQDCFKYNTSYKPDFYLPRIEDPYGNEINLWIEAKPGYNPSPEDIQKMKNFIYGNTSKIQNALLLIGQVPRQFKEIINMFNRTKNESIPFYSLKMINGENIIPCFVFQNKEGKTVLRKLDKKYPDIDYDKIREFFVNAHSENFENKDIF